MPDVILAEGAPAMGGDGFQKLIPSRENFAIGGTNVVLVDRVGAELLGLFGNGDLAKELGGHSTSPLLEAAAHRFGVDLTHPLVNGDGADLFSVPHDVDFDAMAPFSIHTQKPKVHAASLGDETVAIDGAARDAIWSHATPVTWGTDYAGNKRTSRLTRVSCGQKMLSTCFLEMRILA